MSVSIPGVPANKVVASMSGGVLQPTGAGKYMARPAESRQGCRDYGQCQYGGTHAEDGTVCLSCA